MAQCWCGYDLAMLGVHDGQLEYAGNIWPPWQGGDPNCPIWASSFVHVGQILLVYSSYA
jgi:hypothetical protein